MSDENVDFKSAIEQLGPAGRRDYEWMRELGGESVDDVLPLAVKTCQLGQRIVDIWARIDQTGLVNGRGQKNPLLGVVVQLEKAYSQNWRLLGLSDKDSEGRGRVGRPPGGGGDKFPFGRV